jgi:hypothetical protein
MFNVYASSKTCPVGCASAADVHKEVDVFGTETNQLFTEQK